MRRPHACPMRRRRRPSVAEAPRWRRLWPAAAKGVALFAVALVVFLYAFPATPPNHGKAGIVAGAGGAVILPQQDIERPAPHLVGSARGGSAMDGFIAAPISVATETIAEPTPTPRPTQLTAARCSAMFRDPKHIFRRMWAADAWTKMRGGHPACWSVGRVTSVASSQTREAFFAELRAGKVCQNNWYEGNPGELGRANRMPDFGGKPAPALLGFDETIGDFCASRLGGWNSPGVRQLGNGEMCVRAGINILSLYGKRQPYNVCRNFEWQACQPEPRIFRACERPLTCAHCRVPLGKQASALIPHRSCSDPSRIAPFSHGRPPPQVCAAKGLLPGQPSNRSLLFARAPRDLHPEGETGKPLGKCCGFAEAGAVARGGLGYATDDIFYLETCVFSQICSNGAELFRLRAGQPWACAFDEERFDELRRLLVEGGEDDPNAEQCTVPRDCAEGGVVAVNSPRQL